MGPARKRARRGGQARPPRLRHNDGAPSMSDAVEIDDDVLRDATHSLHLHFGSLMDLPEELRNTLASVYYEVHWLRRKEELLGASKNSFRRSQSVRIGAT